MVEQHSTSESTSQSKKVEFEALSFFAYNVSGNQPNYRYQRISFIFFIYKRILHMLEVRQTLK